MNAVEEESFSESETVIQGKKTVIFAATMLLIGLFAPVMISIFGSYNPTMLIQGMIWTYRFYGGYDDGFLIISPYAWMSMAPFLLLRMIPVSQIYRYYNGKTTRKRAFIATILGDGYMLFSSLFLMFITFGYSSTFHIPLPFQMIFGGIVLLLFRIPEPSTPWKSKEEPKSWWEEKPDSKPDANESW